MKFLTPQSLAAAVIGRGGTTIVEMERSTQALIGVSKVNELYPKTESRVLTATADSERALNEVARQVIEKQIDICNRSPSELGMDENQLRISLLVPKAVIASLVADSGKGVRQLCETSGAMIKIKEPVTSPTPDASQEVLVRGRPQALEHAVRELNHEVSSVNSEPWFSAWAQSATGVVGLANSSSASPAKDGAPRSQSRPASPERGASGGPLLTGLKVLVPPSLARAMPASALAELEHRLQAKLRLSEEAFPRTDSRVLTLRAEVEDSLTSAADWIVERLADVAQSEPSNDSVVWEGNLKLSFLVPKAAAAGIIGKGGNTIKQLVETTGAYIKVRDNPIGNGPEATQKVDVRGPAKGIEQVLQTVNRFVFALREESWFNSWASGAAMANTRKAETNGSATTASRGPPSPAAEAGMELVGRVMEGLPSYVLEESRGFAMTCVVPNRLVGLVIGRGGAGLHEVQSITKTRIAMREIPGDADNRSMNIAGPLLNTCSAYMLMMKRYLDAEKEVMNGR